MKLSLKKISVMMTAMWFGVGGGWALETPTLSVTPSVVGNTYNGFITLNITGLAVGEKVTVQKHLDLNGNGSIDAGEPMMDAFKIADGGAMIIGGITNLNVPFDSNAATGAITTTLVFAPPIVLENIVGQQIFKLVSTNGSFAPVTASLLVTNAATGQALSGTVYSNGVAPLPNAVVVVLPPNGNGYVGAVVADSTGHYRINVNPGTYQLLATLPNFFIDQDLAAQVTLTNGMSATNDLSLTNGTVTISGAIYDPANSNGIGGLMYQLESGSLFGVGFTDANGNYAAAVAPGYWKVKPNKERLPRRAYVVPQKDFQVNATVGDVTNANIALNKGNALFYGRITDVANAPFAGIEFDGSDTNSLYDAKGYSDANGNFTVSVFGDTNLLSPTNIWNCNPFSEANTALANHILNGANNTNVLVGQAILQNFTALPITAQISGRVQDNFGNPVAGVSLYAGQMIGYDNFFSLNGRTDNSGDYTLGVGTGAWLVDFSFGDNHDLAHQGLVDLFGPYNVAIPPTNAMLNLTVYPAGTPRLSQPARISPTQFGFDVIGSVNVNYSVQVSTNLAGTNWANLVTFQLSSNNFPIVDNQATNSPRFYRLLKN